MENNNVYVSLDEYLDSANDIDKRKVLYFLSKNLKRLHENFCYVPYLNLKSIRVNNNDCSQIQFSDINDARGYEGFERLKNEDIFKLSIISFAAYLPGYNISGNGLLNSEVIRENFDNFSYIFHDQDVEYFKNVIVNNDFSYYSDHIDNLEKKSGNNMNKGNTYTYSTPQGKMFADKEAAFTSQLLLGINIAVISMILAVVLMYLK